MFYFPSDLLFTEKTHAVSFTRPIVGDNNLGTDILTSYHKEIKMLEEQMKAFFQLSPDSKSYSTITASILKRCTFPQKNCSLLKLVLSRSTQNLEDSLTRLKLPGNSPNARPLRESIVALEILESPSNHFARKDSSEEQ